MRGSILHLEEYLHDVGGYFSSVKTNATDVPQPTNLINGDFETENLTGWKTSGNALWKINSTIKKEGLYSAQAGKIVIIS